MTKIVFYDTTNRDKQQLTEAVCTAGHQLQFISEPISINNIEADAEMISVFISSMVSEELLRQMPKLKLIACRSTGYNNVDIKAAAARGVIVTNVPAYGEQTVAEYTFMLLLALSRKLLATVEAAGRDNFDQTQLSGFDLFGKTLGILGAGRIGQHVAQIAQGFGMRVLAYDLYPNQQKAQEVGFTYKSCDEVLRESDVLTLHMPYVPDNYHVVNAELLAQCKPGVVLINTARGELVDTKALVEALQSGQVSAAGLDVFEAEHAALAALPNVILTPHNAFNTVEAIRRINEATAANLLGYASGNVPNKVSPEVA